MTFNNNISHVFCGSPFWNYQLSWNTSEPTLTACFQKTVLIWVPCAFLWLMLPFRVLDLYWHKKPSLPLTYLFIAKKVNAVLLLILSLIELFYAVAYLGEKNKVPVVDVVSPTILVLTLVLSILILHIERKGGVMSSGVLTVFWFLLLLGGFFRFLAKVKKVLDTGTIHDMVTFVTFFFHYLLVLIGFFMSCFVHKEPDVQQMDSNICPEERASFLSKISFWWVTGLVVKGYRKVLENEDLWSLSSYLTSSHIVVDFNRYWAKEMEKYKLSEQKQVHLKTVENGKAYDNEIQIVSGHKKYNAKLLTCLLKAFGDKMILAVFYKLIHDILLFSSPVLLKLLIRFTSDKTEFLWKGFLYAVALLSCSTLQSVILHQYFHHCLTVGMKLRTTIVSAVYNKSLKLSNSARKTSTVGEIVNLMSVDAQKFQDLMTYINTVWSGPLQIFIALYFLWLTLGPAILTGVGVLALLIPYNLYLTNAVKKLQMKQMKLKDARMKMMNEVLNGIKVLKLYAWENSFKEQVMRIRNEEVKILRKHAYLNAGTTLAWNCTPVFVSLFTFMVYILSDEKNILDAEKAFVALSLFNILRFPMMMLPNMISSLVQAQVSVARIRAFLMHDELDPSAVQRGSSIYKGVAIDNGIFKWDKDEAPILKDIQLKIPTGSLIAVIGMVGSGKSSLLSAILGEMEKTAGSVRVEGSVAYVPQQSWIQNKTLQDNILFGKPLSKSLYNKTIEACALLADLQILPAGDQTEIGEKGINLSGGQKQRVSLARAVYQNADVYLLDDPLSAVDSHVGKHLFDQVIGNKGMLAGKTRILVTHGIGFLHHADMVVVLKNGQITEKGTFQELMAHKGAFSDFLQTYLTEQMKSANGFNKLMESEEDIVSLMDTAGMDELKKQFSQEKTIHLSQSTISLSSELHVKSTTSLASLASQKSVKSKTDDKEATPKDKLIQAETAMTGNVKFSVFSTYGKAIGLKFVVFTLIFFLFVGALNIYSNIWLSEWSNDALLIAQNGTIDTAQRDLRLGVYGTIGLTESLMVVAADLFLLFGCLHAAGLLHQNLLRNVLFSPMTFFDQTPIGRLLNRFGKDVETMDFQLVKNIESWILCLLKVLSVPIVVMLTTPFFALVCIPLFVIYAVVQRFYIATSRQLKRLESVNRSPIFSHFGETVTGVASIRAYNKQDQFITESENKVDNNNVAYYPTIVINRWLAFRVEFMSNLIVFFASVFAVLNRDTLSPGSVGLSISYALSITQTLNWLIRMTSELETNIVSVERIKEYSETPTEAATEIPNYKPPSEWPDKGEVIFSNYATRYREEMDLVIKDINCHIHPGEKIGVVGRTGAGKSSLTLGLFRIIEPASGIITIDGLDISKMGLHDLRSKLTIIPQDPVLFSGTLRMNLDPFEQYDDARVWEALAHSHLKEFVSSQAKGLMHECTEGGENLSLGQRQLVCLARALLRKTKILILDEATAAVDLETDDLIQQTIHSEFRECTILTIAHRINTIMDYSRIMVLDNGKICEFDTPESLLQNKDSLFYSMAAAVHLVGERPTLDTVDT